MNEKWENKIKFQQWNRKKNNFTELNLTVDIFPSGNIPGLGIQQPFWKPRLDIGNHQNRKLGSGTSQPYKNLSSSELFLLLRPRHSFHRNQGRCWIFTDIERITSKYRNRHNNFNNLFLNFKAQPRVSNNVFGPASDCIPYFSEPIWSGIMIMTLLIVVAMTAILMILDIHANDKFDDPKGKIITITNAE